MYKYNREEDSRTLAHGSMPNASRLLYSPERTMFRTLAAQITSCVEFSGIALYPQVVTTNILLGRFDP
jgi:hypothetical protein